MDPLNAFDGPPLGFQRLSTTSCKGSPFGFLLVFCGVGVALVVGLFLFISVAIPLRISAVFLDCTRATPCCHQSQQIMHHLQGHTHVRISASLLILQRAPKWYTTYYNLVVVLSGIPLSTT